jgi:hypothetical protein
MFMFVFVAVASWKKIIKLVRVQTQLHGLISLDEKVVILDSSVYLGSQQQISEHDFGYLGDAKSKLLVIGPPKKPKQTPCLR